MSVRESTVNRLFQVLALAAVGAFILAAAGANSDLVLGRHALFMDERITFDGVARILHPADADSFLWAVADGGDHRYGRVLWNATALASYLPERLWGDAGQIVAARMLHAVILVAAGLVFALGLLRRWPLRFVLLAAFLSMPYADYYATMPKPEPLQLLFLALFGVFAARRGLRFGWHWLFLGLAVGAKISALPAAAVFAGAALLAARAAGDAVDAFERAASALVFFCAGFAIAVPIFLEPMLLVGSGYLVLVFLRDRAGLALQAALAASGLAWIALDYRRPVGTWLLSTIGNTAHGADRESIDAWRWAGYFLDTWMAAPAAIATLACIAAAAFVAMNAALCLRQDAEARRPRAIGLALAAAGAAWNLSIFVAAHRLWGFYLLPGTALALVGTLVLAEACMAPAARRAERYAAYAIVSLALILALACWAPHTAANFDATAHRTQGAEHRAQRAAYDAVVSFLDERSAAASGRLRVAYDPRLYVPASSPRARIVEFWGPYTQWNEPNDAIVFSVKHTPAGAPVPRDSPEYPAYAAEREGYARHVIGAADRCLQPRCYRRALDLPAGGELLLLEQPAIFRK